MTKETVNPSESVAPTFRDYLSRAASFSIDAYESGADKGALNRRLLRLEHSVEENWAAVTPAQFMQDYIFCVGSIQKKYARRMDDRRGPSYRQLQLALLRDGDPGRITNEAHEVRAEWKARKVDLSPKMVDAALDTASRIARLGWPRFKSEYLQLPIDPTSQKSADWNSVFAALKRLPMVGKAIAPYIVRNLYGGAFFKPDVHIEAIAMHYFGGDADRIDQMTRASKALWPTVVPTRAPAAAREPNIGIVDYVLWFYRQATGAPESPSTSRRRRQLKDAASDGA